VREHMNFEDKNLAEKGFTLVELLVVIIILGILAAVVVFAVGGITDRGEESACEIEVRSVQTAIEAYRAQNDNALPANLDALVPLYLASAPDANSASGGGSIVGGAYVPTVAC
jgi:prepilin-type N-terminal cleavage/methylation domain-containing protein